MTGTSNRIFAVGRQIALCQDRIDFAWCESCVDTVSLEDYFAVVITGATLGAHQIILTTDMVEVWAFNPNRVFRWIYTAVNQHTCIAAHLSGAPIKFTDEYGTMTVVKRATHRHIVINNVSFTIIVEEERRINAANFR
jgi:hypothetical protein